MNPEWAFGLTAVWFTLTYIGLALGKIPGLHMDRAGIALVGATLMLVTGMLSFDQAISPECIDYKTLALLFGMMIVVGFLRLSGCFQHLSACIVKRIRHPVALLAVIVMLSGLLSAFLINDIVCLALTPLVLHLTRRLRFDPVPHLIALATAANIGSTGTITGNPQNIYIGSHSGIGYLRFAERLLPVAALGLVLNFVVICIVYRRRLGLSNVLVRAPRPRALRRVWIACTSRTPFADLGRATQHIFVDNPVSLASGKRPANPGLMTEDYEPRSTDHGPATANPSWLRCKSVAVTLAAVTLFFVGLPLELVALGAAAMLLLGRTKPRRIYLEIDWSLLVMFAGLFIVVHAFQVHVVVPWGIDGWSWLRQRPVDLLSLASAGLSNLVSNVPAVLLMDPVMRTVPIPSRESAWLALAMSSTFAGNLTLLGSVANLIVVENAGRQGINISFWEYCKVGIPLTVLTLVLGIAWLQFLQY